jgi:hypothetical protein
MAIKSFKMGPGTLKFGTGGTQDASCQVRSCRVVPSENVDTTDDLIMLCGETLKGDQTVTYTYTLEATLLQDIDAAGIVAYSWTNKGVDVAVEFIPNTASLRKVTGTVRMAPIAIGGDSNTRPTSDISLAFTVDPVFAVAP